MNDKPREQSQLTINGFTFEVPEPWSKGELVIESIITHLDKPLRQNPPPDPELIESLRTWGQRDNIILSMRYLGENQEQREYHIIAGRRRLLAALRLGWATISATVYQLNPLLEQALVVDTNSTRSSDPVGEFEALVKLLDEGRKQGLNITNQMLHQATGLSSQTIKKRLMLAQLLPDLQDACFAGKLTVTTAEMACKLPPHQQERLIPILEEKGKLTSNDVEEVKQVVKKEAVNNLPADLFAPVAPVTRPVYIVIELDRLADPPRLVLVTFDQSKVQPAVDGCMPKPTVVYEFPIEL